jgi:hypothetical protein
MENSSVMETSVFEEVRQLRKVTYFEAAKDDHLEFSLKAESRAFVVVPDSAFWIPLNCELVSSCRETEQQDSVLEV